MIHQILEQLCFWQLKKGRENFQSTKYNKLVNARNFPDKHKFKTITLCGNEKTPLENLAPTFLVVHQKTKA
jgi:hypothetical protein